MSPDERRRTHDEKQRAENRKYGAPVNISTSWEAEEDERLRDECRRGIDLTEIARMHERCEVGILDRLVTLGLLDSLASLADLTAPANTAKTVPGVGVETPRTPHVPFGCPSPRPEKQGSLFDVSPLTAAYE